MSEDAKTICPECELEGGHWVHCPLSPNYRIIVATQSHESEPSAFDRVCAAILELPRLEQKKIYHFLYNLGHRINQ